MELVNDVMDKLKETGSRAVPGFMKPEGVIIYLHEPRTFFKATYDFVDGKWTAQEAA